MVLVKLIICMTNIFQHLLNFVHEGSNVIYAWSWRVIAYKVQCVLKTAFPCKYCTYQVQHCVKRTALTLAYKIACRQMWRKNL